MKGTAPPQLVTAMEPRQADLDEFRVWLSQRIGRDIPEDHIEVRLESLETFLAARPNQIPTIRSNFGKRLALCSWDDITVEDFGDYRLFYDDRKWGCPDEC